MTMAAHRTFRLSRRPDAVLSSGSTSLDKRWLPSIWLAFSAVALFGSLVRIVRAGRFEISDIGFLGLPCLLLALGFAIFRHVSFCLVDEVIDEGESLVIRSNGLEDRVPLRHIVAVLDGPAIRPWLIRLRCDPPCRFGREVTFMPRYRSPWHRSPSIIDELRVRVLAIIGDWPPVNREKAEPGVGADSR